jgi:hypothetical protein
MKTYFRALFSGCLAIGFLSACSHAPAAPEAATSSTAADAMDHRHPAANRRLAVLPDQDAWQALYDYADNLDLANPGVTLTLSSGGTSIYAVINIGGKAVGAIIPENSSSLVSGETLAFTLSRALGVYELYQPGVYHALSGRNLDAFMTVVPRTPIMKNGRLQKNKEENRISILKRYQKQRVFDAVFKRWDEKPKNFEAINGNGPMINTTLVLPGSRSTVASLLQCNGPRPSPAVTVSFNGGTNTEYEAARELSAILLIDALTQQWDRFSGGNLQTITKNGRSMFVSIDNGGTWGGTRATLRNLSMVSRFDRGVAQQILDMDDFFTTRRPYKGLRNDAEFVSAFDIVQAPTAFKKFKESLKLTADHIRRHPNCFF